MRLTKRILFLLISLFTTASLMFLYLTDFNKQPIYILIIFLVILLSSYFSIFRLYGKLKDIYPKFIYWIVLSLLILTVPDFFLALNTYVKIGFYFLCGLFMYINGLALNIYIVAERRMQQIPLLQSAKLVISTSIVGLSFLGSTLIYKLNFWFENTLVFSVLQLALFILFYIVLFQFTKWFYYEQKIGESYYERLENTLSSLRIFSIVVLTQLSVVLNFYPFEDIGKGLIIASVVYVLTNLIQASISRSLNKRFALESYSIMLFIYLLAYFL